MKLFPCLLLLVFYLVPLSVRSQSTSATISGGVTDPTGNFITDASVEVVNDETGVRYSVRTNSSGMYFVPILPPGHYRVQVSRQGFKTIIKADVVLNVQGAIALNFVLPVGATSQSITVEAGSPLLNTTDATVSTVIDRKFVENMPLNGRSFQDLISMTPGVVTQSPQNVGTIQGQGDFSVNGQRTESNYYTVDGVSGNTAPGTPNGLATLGTTGSLSASSALGTTQNLISVDALQEFRVSSSSYSAEYGRMPGGQFSFSSRAGTNTFHGTAFDYLRNDAFDANDWFNNYYGIKKPALRQNDFGGTVGGPIIIPKLYEGRAKSFFFLSYEALRLVTPTNASIQYVPALSIRQSPAIAAPIGAMLNAWPLPTGSEIQLSGVPSGLSTFIKAYSLPSNIDTTSVRFDQTLSDRATVFFRYSHSPTSADSRTLSTLGVIQENSDTYTAGLNNSFTGRLNNILRIGFASGRAFQHWDLDSFGGAVPVDLQTIFGVPGTYDTYQFNPYVSISGVGSTYLPPFKAGNNLRQWNITDTLALSVRNHLFRMGIDQRHLTSPLNPPGIQVYPYYYSRSALLANQASIAVIEKNDPARPTFNEFSAFVQDDWRIIQRLSLAIGVRWDVNPPPGAADGRTPYTVQGDLSNPASLTLAPRGTPLWDTSWYNFAPRLGAAWSARTQPGWETVVRAGGGVFFDTGTQTAAYGFSGLGFNALEEPVGLGMPAPASTYDFTTAVTPPYTNEIVYAYPRRLQSPYVLQWNVSLDQSLGKAQALTISYIGSDGRRLLERQYQRITSFNPLFGYVVSYPSRVTSNYQALQVKFQRSVTKGLQALASYGWSHALDYGSTNASYPLTYGNADFDVRHNFQAGLSWDAPHMNHGALLSALANGWGIDGRINSRTAFPITLLGNLLTDGTGARYYSGVNYDPSKPIYLYGAQYPGGRGLNGGPNVSLSSAAFSLPRGAAAGNAARNFVRGFGAFQINSAIRRDFHIYENAHLTFRAEAFNVFNNPNFGYVDPTLTDAQFGLATNMLNTSLGSTSSLYQQGGSRSMQFSLKLAF